MKSQNDSSLPLRAKHDRHLPENPVPVPTGNPKTKAHRHVTHGSQRRNNTNVPALVGA